MMGFENSLIFLVYLLSLAVHTQYLLLKFLGAYVMLALYGSNRYAPKHLLLYLFTI
jgi:hypothetical protein